MHTTPSASSNIRLIGCDFALDDAAVEVAPNSPGQPGSATPNESLQHYVAYQWVEFRHCNSLMDPNDLQTNTTMPHMTVPWDKVRYLQG